MELLLCALRLREGIYKQFKPLKRGNWKGYQWLGIPPPYSTSNTEIITVSLSLSLLKVHSSSYTIF